MRKKKRTKIQKNKWKSVHRSHAFPIFQWLAFVSHFFYFCFLHFLLLHLISFFILFIFHLKFSIHKSCDVVGCNEMKWISRDKYKRKLRIELNMICNKCIFIAYKPFTTIWMHVSIQCSMGTFVCEVWSIRYDGKCILSFKVNAIVTFEMNSNLEYRSVHASESELSEAKYFGLSSARYAQILNTRKWTDQPTKWRIEKKQSLFRIELPRWCIQIEYTMWIFTWSNHDLDSGTRATHAKQSF